MVMIDLLPVTEITSQELKSTNTTPVSEEQPVDSIAVYSFCPQAEEHQPGTCNFSRIDNAVWNIQHKQLMVPLMQCGLVAAGKGAGINSTLNCNNVLRVMVVGGRYQLMLVIILFTFQIYGLI